MLNLLLPLTLLIGPTTDSTELRRESLMTALRSGGYTIVLRHARTNRDFKEAMGEVPKERKDQRNLTDDGVRDAKLMGAVFRKFGTPIGEIIASPMYRTVETAEMAAGTPSTTMALRVHPATAEQAALVAAAPKPGTNRLLVTHHFVIEAHVPGITPGAIAESEAAVIRTTADGKVQLVGRITLPDWEAMGGVEPTKSATAATGGHGYGVLHIVADTGHAVVPDTPAARIALAYMAAFNSGSPERMRTFLDTYMVVDPNRPTSERIRTYEGMFERFGTLTVSTGHTSQANEAAINVESKQGRFRLTVKTSDTHPTRATSVAFVSTEARGHP